MSDENLINFLLQDFNVKHKQIKNLIDLHNSGASIPFIARYRKEMTGDMDVEKIRSILDKYSYYEELEERKAYVLKEIEKQSKLTSELEKKIKSTKERYELEDLFSPYKKKRTSRAEKAKKMGLAPLAEDILNGALDDSIHACASRYVPKSDDLEDIEDVLEWTGYLLADKIASHQNLRQICRKKFFNAGKIYTTSYNKRKDPDSKFIDYSDWETPVDDISSHNYLALYKGENEDVLRYDFKVPTEPLVNKAKSIFLKNSHEETIRNLITEWIEYSFKNLLFPSIKRDLKNKLKDQADGEAIKVFEKNLKGLLLAPPKGEANILAIDPGYKSGCKYAILDQNSNPVDHGVFYPLPPNNQRLQTVNEIKDKIDEYDITALITGDGKGGRKVYEMLKELKLKLDSIEISLVREDGASIYSVSDIAEDEFPDLDPSLRGAISIGRRFQDPLAELVKIDPQSLGVGQYQHEVNQTKLKKSLQRTVEYCVNYVGVDVNTASKPLLSYISGIGETLAKRLIAYRNEHEGVDTKNQLLNVKGVGDKVFQQAAGFLRIKSGEHPLDNTGIHPERYNLVDRIASDLDMDLTELLGDKKTIEEINWENYISEEVGRASLEDIKKELLFPGRDPRGKREEISFRPDIHEINDIDESMILPGKVTNITNFGVFVDVGIEHMGLVHISEIATEYVKDPHKYVSLGEPVKVKVLEVLPERKRIHLSMKSIAQD